MWLLDISELFNFRLSFQWHTECIIKNLVAQAKIAYFILLSWVLSFPEWAFKWWSAEQTDPCRQIHEQPSCSNSSPTLRSWDVPDSSSPNHRFSLSLSSSLVFAICFREPLQLSNKTEEYLIWEGVFISFWVSVLNHAFRVQFYVTANIVRPWANAEKCNLLHLSPAMYSVLLPLTWGPVTVRPQNESGEQTSSMEDHCFSGGFVFCQMSLLKQLTSGLAIARSLDARDYVARGGNEGCYSCSRKIQA